MRRSSLSFRNEPDALEVGYLRTRTHQFGLFALHCVPAAVEGPRTSTGLGSAGRSILKRTTSCGRG